MVGAVRVVRTASSVPDTCPPWIAWLKQTSAVVM